MGDTVPSDFRRTGGVSSPGGVERALPMRRILAVLAMTVVLAGCREVRVNQVRSGTTVSVGPREIAVVRDKRSLEALAIAANVDFRKEFAVILLLGPHRETGWNQIVESIKAGPDRFRIVAFERAPLDGGEPAPHEYRTFTMWTVPNVVYRAGAMIEVVNPSGERLAATTLK